MRKAIRRLFRGEKLHLRHLLRFCGNLVINEVLANNRTAVLNGGRRPDYIELKNNSAAAIDISGYGFSDDPLLPGKFVFPAGTTVVAGGYLIVWCDNDSLAPGLHSGFALDSGGETLTLTQGGTIVDSITSDRKPRI
jgi:hypothetical protein